MTRRGGPGGRSPTGRRAASGRAPRQGPGSPAAPKAVRRGRRPGEAGRRPSAAEPSAGAGRPTGQRRGTSRSRAGGLASGGGVRRARTGGGPRHLASAGAGARRPARQISPGGGTGGGGGGGEERAAAADDDGTGSTEPRAEWGRKHRAGPAAAWRSRTTTGGRGVCCPRASRGSRITGHRSETSNVNYPPNFNLKKPASVAPAVKDKVGNCWRRADLRRHGDAEPQLSEGCWTGAKVPRPGAGPGLRRGYRPGARPGARTKEHDRTGDGRRPRRRPGARRTAPPHLISWPGFDMKNRLASIK